MLKCQNKTNLQHCRCLRELPANPYLTVNVEINGIALLDSFYTISLAHYMTNNEHAEIVILLLHLENSSEYPHKKHLTYQKLWLCLFCSHNCHVYKTDFKGMVVVRNGGLVLVGVWSSLEIWIDGVFRVFTFVTPNLKILGKKKQILGKKVGLRIS